MEKLRATIEYCVAVWKLTEAQFFSLVAEFYHYFFDQGDNDV